MKRAGRKKMPFYQIVAADGRAPRDGKFLEVIGHYNPTAKPHTVTIERDRVSYWLNVGAQPTATVHSLLRGTGLLHEMNLKRRGISETDIAAQMEQWQQKETERRQKRITVKLRRRQAKKAAEATAAAGSAEA
ncbi:MAG TPA: 30S ribosomal protein S16 [Chlorobaculum sp.]|nr:30S ribosomal protein S16 [Chlorobaculum sp.]